MCLFIIRSVIKLTDNIIYRVNSVTVRNFANILHNQQVPARSTLNDDRETTLKGRIMHYLNLDKEQTISNILNQNQSMDVLSNIHSKNVECLSVDELLFSITNVKRIPFNDALQRLDIACSLRIHDFDIQQLFQLLNAFMHISPNMIKLKFYKCALTKLSDCTNHMSKQELLRLFFYIGLQKNKYPQYKITLRHCMKSFNDQFISNLTLEEICVICHSYFKSSTKIDNKIFLDQIKLYINENLSILKDPALFTTLIKTIRHNRHQDDNLLSTIASAFFFNRLLRLYLFPELCHIFALFADYHYYDPNITKVFTKKCVEEMKNAKYKRNYFLRQLRGKDITRLLFCLSDFSYFKPIEKEDIENIVIPKILEGINFGEFDKQIDILVDIGLYLWMLNYRPYQLVPYIVNKDYIKILEAKKTHSKERLNLLLYCIFIEDRDFYNKLNLKPMLPQTRPVDFHLNRRPFLMRILHILKSSKLQLQTELKRFEISYEIPYINIIGITAYKKKIYKAAYIEILDDVTCLKNVEEDVPIGLMELKLRLLNQREEGIVVLSQKDLESVTEAELEEILIDEIKLVC